MKTRILFVLSISCIVVSQHQKKSPRPQTEHSRLKRNAVGALHIVTNHAQPIHADVKADSEATEKPCPEGSRPSRIESGVGFQVTPPEDAEFIVKSLRKSLPLQPQTVLSQPQLPKTLLYLRNATRIVTFVVLFVSAVCECYSLFATLMTTKI